MNNKEIVNRLVVEAEEQGNLAVVDELLADDFVDLTPLPGMPANRDGVRALFGMLHTAFPDLKITIQEQIAEGEKVATRKEFAGTHRGEFLGAPPTNGPVKFEVIDILTVRDQKIVSHRVILDQLGLLKQLGAI